MVQFYIKNVLLLGFGSLDFSYVAVSINNAIIANPVVIINIHPVNGLSLGRQSNYVF